MPPICARLRRASRAWNTVRGFVRPFARVKRFSGESVEELAPNPAGTSVHAEAKDSFSWSRRCLHERFLSLSLSLSSLSLSRAVFTIKWSRRNWHPPDTIKHLKSYYSKSKLLRTNTLKCIAPSGYSMSRTFVLITHNKRVQRHQKKRNFTRHSLSTRDTRPRERRRVKGSETRVVANDKIGN